jgi:hypothetical protein
MIAIRVNDYQFECVTFYLLKNLLSSLYIGKGFIIFVKKYSRL